MGGEGKLGLRFSQLVIRGFLANSIGKNCTWMRTIARQDTLESRPIKTSNQMTLVNANFRYSWLGNKSWFFCYSMEQHIRKSLLNFDKLIFAVDQTHNLRRYFIYLKNYTERSVGCYCFQISFQLVLTSQMNGRLVETLRHISSSSNTTVIYLDSDFLFSVVTIPNIRIIIRKFWLNRKPEWEMIYGRKGLFHPFSFEASFT